MATYVTWCRTHVRQHLMSHYITTAKRGNRAAPGACRSPGSRRGSNTAVLPHHISHVGAGEQKAAGGDGGVGAGVKQQSDVKGMPCKVDVVQADTHFLRLHKPVAEVRGDDWF